MVQHLQKETLNMNKKNILVALMTIALINNTAILTSADNLSTDVSISQPESKADLLEKVAQVASREELEEALKNKDIRKIIVTKDLYIVGDIKIERPVILELNGHKIKFNSNSSLHVGKVSTCEREVTKYQPGHFVTGPTTRKVVKKGHYEEKPVPGNSLQTEKVWVPETKETRSNEYHWVDGYSYKVTETAYIRENMDVEIRNGSIYGKNGENGEYSRDGKNGKDGSSAIVMKSGSLRLINIKAVGGDAGNGLDGDMTIGRSGGNGGNGQPAIRLEGGTDFMAEGCNFIGGTGGKGGKKSHQGWTSIFCFDGSNGKNEKSICNYGNVKVHVG